MKFELVMDSSYDNYTVWKLVHESPVTVQQLTVTKTDDRTHLNKLVGKYFFEVSIDKSSLILVFLAEDDAVSFQNKFQQSLPDVKITTKAEANKRVECSIALTGDNRAKHFIDAFFQIDTIQGPVPFVIKSLFNHVFGFDMHLLDRYKDELGRMLLNFIKNKKIMHEDLKKLVKYAKNSGHPKVLSFLAEKLDNLGLHLQAALVKVEAIRQPKVAESFLSLPDDIKEIKEAAETEALSDDDGEDDSDTTKLSTDAVSSAAKPEDSERKEGHEARKVSRKQLKQYLRVPEIELAEALLSRKVIIPAARLHLIFEQGLEQFNVVDDKPKGQSDRSSVSIEAIPATAVAQPIHNRARIDTLNFVLRRLQDYREFLESVDDPGMPAIPYRLTRVAELINLCINEMIIPTAEALESARARSRTLQTYNYTVNVTINSDKTSDLLSALSEIRAMCQVLREKNAAFAANTAGLIIYDSGSVVASPASGSTASVASMPASGSVLTFSATGSATGSAAGSVSRPSSALSANPGMRNRPTYLPADAKKKQDRPE